MFSPPRSQSRPARHFAIVVKLYRSRSFPHLLLPPPALGRGTDERDNPRGWHRDGGQFAYAREPMIPIRRFQREDIRRSHNSKRPWKGPFEPGHVGTSIDQASRKKKKRREKKNTTQRAIPSVLLAGTAISAIYRWYTGDVLASCFRSLDERPINYRPTLIGRLIKSATPRERRSGREGVGSSREIRYTRRIFVRSTRPDSASCDGYPGQMFPRHGPLCVGRWSIRPPRLLFPARETRRRIYRADLCWLTLPCIHLDRNEQRYFVTWKQSIPAPSFSHLALSLHARVPCVAVTRNGTLHRARIHTRTHIRALL